MYFFERALHVTALAALASALLLLATAAPAHATPNFPPRIAAELEIGAAPQCSLCHEGATKLGTVTSPFGTSMRGRGLVPYDEGSLVNALLALEGEGTDSDGDAVGDIDELRQGADPNLIEGGEAPIVADYGCSTGTPGIFMPGAGHGAFALLFLVALARRITPLAALASRKAAR